MNHSGINGIRIMYEGIVTDDVGHIPTNSIYLFQLSHNTIVSYTLV